VRRSGARTSKRPIKSSNKAAAKEGDAVCFLWRASCRPASRALPATTAAAAPCSLLAVLLLLLLLLLLKLLLLVLLLGSYCCSCLLLLPCLFASCLLLHLLPRSTPAVRCSFFAFSSCSFSTSCLSLPRLLLLFLFSSCCFLAFGRFSLVPSDLRGSVNQRSTPKRAPPFFALLFYLLLPPPCSPPPLPPPSHNCVTTSRCLRRQLFPTFADNKSFSHTA
jgi:hypothetical protein